MLIEGVMAIQRIIDEDNLPTDGNGKRIPLNLALEPNYEPAAQPVDCQRRPVLIRISARLRGPARPSWIMFNGERIPAVQQFERIDPGDAATRIEIEA